MVRRNLVEAEDDLYESHEMVDQSLVFQILELSISRSQKVVGPSLCLVDRSAPQV